jgi:8-oxo-dGTP pyrophosphatase MutT (NUDIX family)
VGASEPPIAQECVEGYVYCRAPPRLLILRRPPARGRIWAPVSGKVDPGDADYPSALRRELAEETGFREFARIFPLDWEVPFTGPDGRPWRLHAYGVELDAPEEPRLSDEHEAFAWVPMAEAIGRLHYEDNKEAVRRLVRGLAPGGAFAPPNV